MGMGKTEAALAATELLGARHGLGGLFFGLPTQATSNQAFRRVRRWLERLGPGTFLLQLAHGKAQQLAEYQDIVNRGAPASIDEDGDPRCAVTAEEWFAGPKRRLLSPFVVGTVDQVLMCAAKIRHVAFRQVGLSGKVVVVDEVHAYDAHMSVFLHRALRWLGEAGVPVLLLSATLPPTSRCLLARAYAGKDVSLGPVSYPSVTTVSREAYASSLAIEAESKPARASIELLREEGGEDHELVARRAAAMASGGTNVLLVRNTVGRAQATYKAVAGLVPAGSAHLLHGRFTAADRLAKERWLASSFGPRGDRPSGHVVVGTQVLEQSLDVDFDVLITDLAPIDLVLQRLGRVHRHEHPRPAGFEEPVLIIAGASLCEKEPPVFSSGSVAVYKDHLLLRSAAVLLARGQVVVPDDVPELVALVYGADDVVPPAWPERASVAAAAWAKSERDRRAKAESYAVPPPERLPSLLEFERFGVGDPHDEDDPAVQAAVRDSDPTIEVVLGYPSELPDCMQCRGVDVPLDSAPSPAQTDLLLSSTVHLPSAFTPAALDLEVPRGWLQHPWTRGLRLLRLDGDAVGEIGTHVVAYSEEMGLEVHYGHS